MQENKKQSVYLERATHAEEKAAKAANAQDRLTWMQVAKEYREAARDAAAQTRRAKRHSRLIGD